MGALASVNVMGNKLGKEELAKLQVIMKAHSTLQSLCGIAADATEANLSGLGMDAADAAILADDIQDKGALAKLTWSGEQYRDDNFKLQDAPPVTLDMDMKEADFSNKHLGVSGAIILAAFIKRKSFQDNGALASLDISGNHISSEQEASIKQVCAEKSINCTF